ncbi:hemin-degrading factor [Rhodobacteraceae bacterium NNCM2]|nr:hemin-degrading factor [Coraliihabitans acroporae]
MDMTPQNTLAEAWSKAKAEDPGARARDIADKLGVTEGVMADARVGAEVKRLGLSGAGFIGLLEGLQNVGPVMTLTRNDGAVHETTGQIGEVAAHGMIGQVTGAIDLRLFLRNWRAGYRMVEETRSGTRHSVQVFDVAGVAVIKIYATEETDMDGWNELVASYVDESGEGVSYAPIDPPAPDRPDAEIDREVLRSKWQAIEHTHDFHRMLREVGAGRQQALRLAGDDLACPVDTAVVEKMLTGAAAQGIPIMCFVGNAGCIQIFSGPVSTIRQMGPWLNVLDPGFNLHLRTDRVAQVWAVRKPTMQRGTITSLELYDSEGELICQFFGVRPPGEGEREAWREVLNAAIGGRE